MSDKLHRAWLKRQKKQIKLYFTHARSLKYYHPIAKRSNHENAKVSNNKP